MGGAHGYFKKNKTKTLPSSNRPIRLASLPPTEEKKPVELSAGSLRDTESEEKIFSSSTATHTFNTPFIDSEAYPKPLIDLIGDICKQNHLIESEVLALIPSDSRYLNDITNVLIVFFTKNLPCTKKIIALLVQEERYAHAIGPSLIKLQTRVSLTEELFTPILETILEAGFFAPALCDTFCELCINKIAFNQKIFDTIIQSAPSFDVYNIKRALINITTYLLNALDALKHQKREVIKNKLDVFFIMETYNESEIPHEAFTLCTRVNINYEHDRMSSVTAITLNDKLIDAIAIADDPEELAATITHFHQNEVSLSADSLILLAGNSMHSYFIFNQLKMVKDQDIKLTEAQTQEIINAKDRADTKARSIIKNYKAAKEMLTAPSLAPSLHDEEKIPPSVAKKNHLYSLHRIFKKPTVKKYPEKQLKAPRQSSHSGFSRS